MSATFSVSSFLQLAVIALLAVPHGVLADTSLGCVSVSSKFAETFTLTANGPTACQEKCTAAVRFCVCASSEPTIEKTYDSSACSFTCPSPYEAYTCGGEDSSTFDFIYNLYYSGSSSSTTSSTTAAAQTTSGTSTTPSSTATSTVTSATPTTSSHSTTVTTADAVSTPSTIAGTTSSIPSSSTGTITSISSTSSETSITGQIFQTTETTAGGSSTSTVPRTVFVSTVDCSCTDDDVATSTTSTLTVEETHHSLGYGHCHIFIQWRNHYHQLHKHYFRRIFLSNCLKHSFHCLYPGSFREHHFYRVKPDYCLKHLFHCYSSYFHKHHFRRLYQQLFQHLPLSQYHVYHLGHQEFVYHFCSREQFYGRPQLSENY
ncbi:hypothetical protein CMQ_6069 [Grosmannia clavigera kw1407]|uniref:WSC domain-containing protein n=1 Tax=Grosmannia clavigera (strain kw1407 / UAMH 11150) TaxID=655863 RepID=F0XLH0_GROCL|nr:uncharacterized protein CMQ_6069 [Grosmannia clavigera kw1407]EFX01127.1 hypothetical protein CMQ_6069 [Grosmannia clavigera kw1407]